MAAGASPPLDAPAVRDPESPARNALEMRPTEKESFDGAGRATN